MAMGWLKGKNLEERLKEGEIRKYMGILDTYAVQWSLEKAARDTLQNFFDANGNSLDGIDVKITETSGEHMIRVEGDAEYDCRMLLHLGGTAKTGDRLASGGFGEGAKILALSLLRDYGFSQVRFGSSQWVLDFALEKLEDGEYVEERKGLFAILRAAEQPIKGNFIQFRTRSKEQAQAFANARDLFFHSENPDFLNPTLEVPSAGGFKFLGGPTKGKNSIFDIVPSGNFYYAGQRRHFALDEWNTVEFVNIWTHVKDCLKNDRDRGTVFRYEMKEKVIPLILDAADEAQVVKALYAMEPIWGEYSFSENRVGPKIIQGIVERLAKRHIKLPFADKYLAREDNTPINLANNLIRAGYSLCVPCFAAIGMKTVGERFYEMSEHFRIKPSLYETMKIGILYDAAFLLGKEIKDIWLFERQKENSIIEGQYNGIFVWMSREMLQKPFNAAFATYLHELDHKYGSDYSADFSYALTYSLEKVIEKMLEKPDAFRKLEEQWNRQK